MRNLDLPGELNGWEPKVGINELVFHLPKEGDSGFVEAVSVYRKIEGWMELVADKWGSVNLKWDGCNQGLRKPPFLRGNMTNSNDGIINPERFDELLKTHRIFGSAMNGIDYPLLKALETMVESEYPCSLLQRENNHRIWFNNKIIEQGLEDDIAEGVGRDLTNYWVPTEREEMIRDIDVSGSTVDLSYRAAIIPPKWGNFRSHIIKVESLVGICHLHIMQQIDEIPNPLIQVT